MKPLRWLTVSLTLATAVAPTVFNGVLSLIGCTRLRAVSGILQTQRGRRGSGGVGPHAGTVSAGPSKCGRPGLHLHRVCLSPLWLKPASRPCGSTLAGVGHRPLAIGHGCPLSSRAAYRRARSPARIRSPLSSSSGAVGRARAGAAGRGSPSAQPECISGARRRSEPALSCARIAGPSQCGGSPAPRGCASLGVTGLSAAT
jgi:hypothetical protein